MTAIIAHDSPNDPAPRITYTAHRLTAAPNIVVRFLYFSSATGTSKTAVLTTPLRWNCTQIR
jgi:hypothetical protein